MRLEQTLEYLTMCEVCGGPLFNADELSLGTCEECQEWAFFWTHKMLSDPKVVRSLARKAAR
jgi:hypothetical protein